MFLMKSNLSSRIKDKVLPLIAIGFPGGYKFFIVIMITTFASISIATDFSKIFFWIALLTTFSGLPIASLMIAPQFVISAQHKIFLVITSSSLCFLIAYIIELNQYSHSNNLFIYLSVLCLSSYEVLKRHFLNEANFTSLFIASCYSMVLVTILLLSMFLLDYESVGLLLMASFVSLVLPLLYLRVVQKPLNETSTSNFSEICIAFMRYVLSNATSTSLLFALPILLVAEIGHSIATDLAQVFYFTSLTYLIPHALSAKHIPNMRNNGINIKDIKVFFRSILLFVFIITVISLPLLQYFYLKWEVFFLLFIAMQISQVSLPFSNILMVKGEASMILKVNMISSFTLTIITLLTIFLLESGEGRAKVLLFAFIGFQFLKLLLNYTHSKKYIQ